MTQRRDWLKLVALAPCALSTRMTARGQDIPFKSDSTIANRTHELKLGVVTYSVRDLKVDAIIAAMKQLEVESVSPYRLHLPIEIGSAEECRTVAQKFRDAGIDLAGTGVVELRNNESSMRRAFDNAVAANLSLITIRPQPDCLPLLDRLVKEFNVKVAIHNHGPEDKLYPDPEVTWQTIRHLDPRIGICIDFGHAARAGADPIASIRRCRDRLYDFHLKDSVALPRAPKDNPVEIGRGRLDIRAALAALMEIDYRYQVGVEYDRQGVDLVTGLAESVGYVRGMLTAMSVQQQSG